MVMTNSHFPSFGGHQLFDDNRKITQEIWRKDDLVFFNRKLIINQKDQLILSINALTTG